MKYMGSKSKIKKYIIPIIYDRINNYGCKTYIEPFVGGANVIDDINGIKRIGSDNNEKFWNWVRKTSEKNIVLVSEESAPADMKCVWELS